MFLREFLENHSKFDCELLSSQTNHQNGPILFGKVLSSGFQNIQCTINPKLMSNTKSNFNQKIYKGCKNISIVDIKKQLSFKKSITADIQTHFLTYWTLRTMGYPETYWMKVINLCILYREMFSNWLFCSPKYSPDLCKSQPRIKLLF